MSYINFRNNGAQLGFQNALNMGLQFGAQAAESANRRGFNNALAGYDPNNPDSFKEVAKYDPRLGLELRKESQAQQAAQIEADLTQKFMDGDEAAGEELARVNFDKWAKIDTRQKEAALQESQVLGNAAIDVLRLPPEQRSAAVAAYARQIPQFGDEIGQIAQLPPQQLEQALRAQVAEAKLIGQLHQMEQPNFKALAQDEVFVDVKNPKAVAQFTPNNTQIVEGTLNGNPVFQNPRTGKWFTTREEAMQ